MFESPFQGFKTKGLLVLVTWGGASSALGGLRLAPGWYVMAFQAEHQSCKFWQMERARRIEATTWLKPMANF